MNREVAKKHQGNVMSFIQKMHDEYIVQCIFLTYSVEKSKFLVRLRFGYEKKFLKRGFKYWAADILRQIR